MSNKRPTEHKKRTPIHKQSAVHVANQDPNFKYRVVNDSEGRIDSFLEGGYIVAGDESEIGNGTAQSASQMGSVKRVVVNKGRDASTNHGILMKIPKHLYEEDQRDKQRKIDRTTASYDPNGMKARADTYGDGLKEEQRK